MNLGFYPSIDGKKVRVLSSRGGIGESETELDFYKPYFMLHNGEGGYYKNYSERQW